MLTLHPQNRHLRHKRGASSMHLRRRQRGQGLVEFALMSPFLIILMFVTIDFGIGLNHRVVVTNDAREAARYAATGKSVAEIKKRAQEQSEGLIKDGAAFNCGKNANEECVQVKFYDLDSATNPGLNPGDAVAVKLIYRYKILTPLPNFISAFPKSFEMNACTDMRLEQVPVAAPTPITGASPCS